MTKVVTTNVQGKLQSRLGGEGSPDDWLFCFSFNWKKIISIIDKVNKANEKEQKTDDECEKFFKTTV